MEMNSKLISSYSLSIGRSQKGFTLIEVMVALTIFAMLSVLGWQVFDNLNRSKNRAKFHADSLSELQFAYLQVQNDINQITAWQTLPLATSLNTEDKTSTNSNTTSSNDSTGEMGDYNTLSFFELSGSNVSFIRYADSDPRYKSSPTFVNIAYALEGKSLVRYQTAVVIGGDESNSQIASVLLTNIENLQLQAFTPEAVSSFSSQPSDEIDEVDKVTEQEPQLLPKGLSLSFSYRDEPISWTLALPKQSPVMVSNYNLLEKEGSESTSPSLNTSDTPSSNSIPNSNSNSNTDNGNQSGSDSNKGKGDSSKKGSSNNDPESYDEFEEDN